MTMGQQTIGLGQIIPSFSLKDQKGEWIEIKPPFDSYVLLFFYPKNGTKVCAEQACSLRDNYSVFQEYNCKLYGISSDSVASHKKNASNLGIKFPMLSDADGKVRKAFGAKQFFGLIPKRISYLLNKEGKVIYVYDELFQLEKHTNAIIHLLKQQS